MVAGKRKAVEGSEGVEEPSNVVEVIPLGAGQEVGRSCIIIKYMCGSAAKSLTPVRRGMRPSIRTGSG